MFIITLLDTETNKTFDKEFWDYVLFKKFLNKVKYSKKLKVLSTLDNSRYYG